MTKITGNKHMQEPQLSLVTKTVVATFDNDGYYPLPEGTTHLEITTEVDDCGDCYTTTLCIKETPITDRDEIRNRIAAYEQQLLQYQQEQQKQIQQRQWQQLVTQYTAANVATFVNSLQGSGTVSG